MYHLVMQRRGVIGVDSSTQSCKAVLLDPDTGVVLDSGAAPHPEGTEVEPQPWADTMDALLGPLRHRADAMGVAGQQHGLIALDGRSRVVRPALLWNDTRSADAGRQLLRDKGPGYWVSIMGALPDAALTVSKLAWLAESEPESLARTESISLPHDWLSRHLTQGRTTSFTDVSEASGTGYFTLSHEYDRQLVEDVAGKALILPEVLEPNAIAGTTAEGILVSPGGADNAAAAFGLELVPGEVVVSLGTSGTVYTVSDTPLDASGGLANFADITGRYLPLVCTLNAARVLTSTAALLGVGLAEFGRLALGAPRDADGMLLVPYLDGERYPSLPEARGSLLGMTRGTMTPEHLAQATTLGMLCGIAEALDALTEAGPRPERVLLIGGAAQSAAVRAAAPAILGCSVDLPVPLEYVARGAARQASWVFHGDRTPPAWGRSLQASLEVPSSDWGAEVRARFAEARRSLFP